MNFCLYGRKLNFNLKNFNPSNSKIFVRLISYYTDYGSVSVAYNNSNYMVL